MGPGLWQPSAPAPTRLRVGCRQSQLDGRRQNTQRMLTSAAARLVGDGVRRVATTPSMARLLPAASNDSIFLDPFCFKQFDDPSYRGTKIGSCTKEQFQERLNRAFESGGGDAALSPGYAPFCKHLFVANFTDAVVGALPISIANQHLLRSGYAQRNERELAVLTRWFQMQDVAAEIRKAQWLDIILYSREQLRLEYAAQGLPVSALDALSPAVAWGVVGIKGQDEDFELPMSPITMMRNALGKEQGGSGIPLEKGSYESSVAYWEKHAVIQ